MEIRYELSDPSLVAVLDIKGDGTVKSACLRAESDGSLTATSIKNVPWASFVKDAKDRATLPDDLAARVKGHMRHVQQRTGSSTSSRVRVRPDARRKEESMRFSELVDEVRQYAESQGLSAAEVVAAAFSTDDITTDYVTASQWVREAPLAVAGLNLGRTPRKSPSAGQ
jgi:hypothetical protein